MNKAPFLSRDSTLPRERDYEALRAVGLERIRRLSGSVWSDHNASDPGITMLEALAYAVTDLGYRTGFDIRDLLTRPDGLIGPSAETGLFPAHKALTCSPITIADHRMVLLRIHHVHNAWLDPMQNPDDAANFHLSEVPIYADCAHDRLSYAATVNGQANHPVELSGLYRVLVELERDDVLGSLNETALSHQFKSGELKGLVVVIDSSNPEFLGGQIDFSAAFSSVRLSPGPSASGSGTRFDAQAGVELQGGAVVELTGLMILVIEDRPRPGADPVQVTTDLLESELRRDDDDAILRLFWLKQRRRQEALARVSCVLNNQRPLCEDWLSVDTIAPLRVGVCADIDLTPEADMELIQARIFHAIEQYFSPPVPWQSLDAMLAEGTPADEIFNGPYIDFSFECAGEPAFTKPGFLTREGLAGCELRRAVHTSDIINLLLDIEGVVSVRGLSLRAYDSAGQPVGPTEAWTLAVPAGHQPVVFYEGSKVLLFKNELPYRAQELEFRRTLEHLRELARAALYVPPGQILPAVVGRWRDLDAAYSVQNDLPQLYGTGPEGLSPDTPAESFAKTRQLKAYLAHFDWLLADYLGQLANVRALLAPDPDLDQTYFPQLATDAAGVLGDFQTEFYFDPVALADPGVRARLTESEETFLDRRSRALDHLLARFSERFADYALMSFSLAGDSLKTARELITDKATFLAEAPLLSRERSAGFDYRPREASRVWDTDNVPGLQKRVSRLLGIEDYTRRDLHCSALFEALLTVSGPAGNVRVRIRASDNSLLFVSDEAFQTGAEARNAARPIFEVMRRAETYEVDTSGGVNAVVLRLNDGAGQVLTHQDQFTGQAEAVRRARAIVDRYDELLQSALCDSEGMHVIEHILLRPRLDGERLMQVCLPADCDFCGEQDPYSFRLHVVLPYWPERFQDLAFRRYAERLISEETPAHIIPRICWIGNEQMRELDSAWHAWLELSAGPGPDPSVLASVLEELINVLERLTTVYPAATLHDCDEGEDQSIVRLGTTNLGLF